MPRAHDSSLPATTGGGVRQRLPGRDRTGVVAIDSLLTVSDSRAMRAGLEELGKPLHAVLLTHSHPDNYGGLTQLVAGDGVPIIAPQGVIDTIARDDDEKEQILRPMFGDEWAAERTFPNTPIGDGESVTFDDATFTVIDLGPSESPHDSPWILGRGRADRLPRRPDLRPEALLPRGRLPSAVARQHRDAARTIPERGRVPHRARRPRRPGRLGLAAQLHRGLPRGGQGARTGRAPSRRRPRSSRR